MFFKILLGLVLALAAIFGMMKLKRMSSEKVVAESVTTSAPGVEYAVCPKCKVYEPTVCSQPGCVGGGKKLCPASCLKKEVGPWVHLKAPGHSDSELWFEFKNPDGSGWTARTQAHIGELWTVEGGKWVFKGRCPTCSGTTRIDCPGCSGKAACKVCSGSGSADAESRVAYLTSKLREKMLTSVKTKDGRTLIGKIMGHINGRFTLRLPDGKTTIIKESDLADA